MDTIKSTKSLTVEEIKALPAGTALKVKFADGSPRRIIVEDEKYIFEFKTGCSRRGWRFSIEWLVKNAVSIEVRDSVEHIEVAWHKRIRRVIKALERNGLWPELLPKFKNLDLMTYEEKKKIADLYWSYERFPYNPHPTKDEIKVMNERFKAHYAEFIDKYPFVFPEDNEGILNVNTFYIWEQSECKLKSMYFGKYDNAVIKDNIASALKEHRSISRRARTSYDVSFEYDAEKNKAWYSEEYKGCGNGHYYLAIDGNAALFCEND